MFGGRLSKWVRVKRLANEPSWSLFISIIASILLLYLVFVISRNMLLLATTPDLQAQLIHVTLQLFFLVLFWGSANYFIFCFYRNRPAIHPEAMPELAVVETMLTEHFTMHHQQPELVEFTQQMISLSNDLQQRLNDLIQTSNHYHIYCSPKLAAENNDADFFDALDDRQIQLKDAHFRYELSLLQQLSSDLDYMVNHLYLQVSSKQDVLLAQQRHILQLLSNRKKLRESYRDHVLMATVNYQSA
ncbi:hypothetical protein ACK33Z_08140 [Aeromonas veronii]